MAPLPSTPLTSYRPSDLISSTSAMIQAGAIVGIFSPAMRILIVALLLATLVGSAQAQQTKAVEFKPSAEKPITSIAIFPVRASRQVKVHNMNAAGTAFGILPAMVYGLDIDKKGAEYSGEMNKR